MIVLVDFHVHFWLFLSKKGHLKGSSAKKGTSTEKFGGADAPSPPLPPYHPCSGGPALSFSPRDLPEGLFVEMNIFNVLPNLKMAFSIAFNLVPKCASCPVAATDIAGAGFIVTIPDAEEMAVVVIVEGEVRVTRILLLPVVIEIVA